MSGQPKRKGKKKNRKGKNGVSLCVCLYICVYVDVCHGGWGGTWGDFSAPVTMTTLISRALEGKGWRLREILMSEVPLISFVVHLLSVRKCVFMCVRVSMSKYKCKYVWLCAVRAI